MAALQPGDGLRARIRHHHQEQGRQYPGVEGKGSHLYTIFNDFSARDARRIEMEGRLGPAKGKSFDGGNVMGPWIVTPDEIGDPYKLKMEARVNGKMRSQRVTDGMLFSFEEIIAHVTKDETLMPGEFMGSGTVGNGCGARTRLLSRARRYDRA
jgi:2-keto-4-pentenoate hydratase/2-oxohepta-3-ene-1,7-dioic acid hydratase in catechol pathway